MVLMDIAALEETGEVRPPEGGLGKTDGLGRKDCVARFSLTWWKLELTPFPLVAHVVRIISVTDLGTVNRSLAAVGPIATQLNLLGSCSKRMGAHFLDWSFK
jgi:hypothetical protein